MPHATGSTKSDPAPAPMLRRIGWLLIAQLVAGGGQFVLGVLLARYLSLEDFGRWAFAFAFVALFSSFADFGLSTLATRDLARGNENAGRYLGSALALKIAQSVLLLCAMAAVLPAVKHDPAITTLVLLLGAQTIVLSFAQLLFALFRARALMHYEALARVCHIAPLLASAAFLIALGANVQAFAWAALATAVFALACTAALAFIADRPVQLAFDRRLATSLLSQVWPIGLGTALTTVYYYADSVLLGIFRPGTDVALYGAAYMPLLGIALIVGALRNAYFPAQSRAFVEGAAERKRLLRQYGRLSAMLALPVAIAGPVIAEPLLRSLYGAEFGAATMSLQALFLAGGVMFLSSYFGSELLVAGKQRAYLAGVGAGAAANVALNLALIPALGIEGAAIATVASESLVCGFLFWQTRKSTVGMKDILMWTGAASALMTASLGAVAQVAPLYLAIATAAVVYPGTLYLFSGASMRRQLPGLVRGARTGRFALTGGDG